MTLNFRPAILAFAVALALLAPPAAADGAHWEHVERAHAAAVRAFDAQARAFDSSGKYLDAVKAYIETLEEAGEEEEFDTNIDVERVGDLWRGAVRAYERAKSAYESAESAAISARASRNAARAMTTAADRAMLNEAADIQADMAAADRARVNRQANEAEQAANEAEHAANEAERIYRSFASDHHDVGAESNP